MMKNSKQQNAKKVYKSIKLHFFELASLIRDVIYSKLQRVRENILVSFCQTNTVFMAICKAAFTLIYMY